MRLQNEHLFLELPGSTALDPRQCSVNPSKHFQKPLLMNQRWQVASQSLSHCPPFSYIIVAYDPTMFCFVQLIFLDYDTRFQNRSTPQCSFLQNKNIRTTIRFSMADKIHTQKHSSIKYVENGLCLLFVIYRNIPRIRTTP